MQYNRSKIITVWLLMLVIVRFQTSLARGQEEKPSTASETTSSQKPILLEEVSVTATRTKEDVSNIPQSVTILTPEEIKRRQARTPNQMLREEPGIWSVQVAAQGSPIIRGQIGNRVLYLWDGIRINNGALFAGPNGFFNQFPIGAVDRMEVIRGPGAVQYGSDAIGGVINIMSKRTDLFPDKLKFGGDVYARYGSVDNEKTEHTDLWLAAKKFNILTGIARQGVDDYEGAGVGTIKNTGFESTGGYARIAYNPVPGHILRLSWIDNRRDNVDTYTQSKLNPSGIPRIFGPFEKRRLVKLDYEAENIASWFKELRSYAYYQDYDSARDFTTESKTQINKTTTDTDQGIFGLGVQMTTPLKIVGEDRLIYGIDYHTENLASAKTLFTTTKSTGAVVKTVPSGNVPDGSYEVFDTFLLSEFKPLKRLSYSLGGRFESTNLDSNPSPEDALAPFTVNDLKLNKRWNSFTWSTGAVYWFTDELGLSGNIATGFRVPTYSDTLSTGVPVFASGIASVPSPGVKPEKSMTYELGPRYLSKKLNISIAGYWTQLTDLLNSEDAGTINIPGVGTVKAKKRVNSGRGYVRGIEAAAAYRLTHKWTAFGNFTYTQGQDTKNHVPLRFIPPTNALLGIRWESQPRKWWAEVTTVVVDRKSNPAPDDKIDAGFSKDPGYGSPSEANPPLRPGFEIPGYAVVNLRGGVEIWSEADRNINLTLNINNLTNRRYREAYSQQQLVAPGTSAVISAELKF